MIRLFFFFSSRRRHTRYWRDWSSDVCSSDLDDRRPPALGTEEAEPDEGEQGRGDLEADHRDERDEDDMVVRPASTSQLVRPNRSAPVVCRAVATRPSSRTTITTLTTSVQAPASGLRTLPPSNASQPMT